MSETKIPFLLLLSIVLFGCTNSQNSSPEEASKSYENSYKVPDNEKAVTLSRAYGYVKGQKERLNRIKNQFPELEEQVILSESRFDLSYGRAFKRIEDRLKVIFKENFDQYKVELSQSLSSSLGAKEITKKQALRFIEKVNKRADGIMNESILQTLLTFQFFNNPHKEFKDKYIRSYSTREHPKAKGASVKIKVPYSWKQKAGERPNVIQKFVSKGGKGQEMFLLMVKNMDFPRDYRFSKDELNKFFNRQGMKEMIGEEDKLISSRKIFIDGNIGGKIIFETERKRLDQSIAMQSVHYITICERKMIFLQCAVLAFDGEETKGRFNLYLPLFRKVANSMVLMNKYD